MRVCVSECVCVCVSVCVCVCVCVFHLVNQLPVLAPTFKLLDIPSFVPCAIHLEGL